MPVGGARISSPGAPRGSSHTALTHTRPRLSCGARGQLAGASRRSARKEGPPARAMATITALPTAGLVDEARYERDATKPGGYGEAAGWLACASVRRRVAGGGGAWAYA
jgi:hypothetical protein